VSNEAPRPAPVAQSFSLNDLATAEIPLPEVGSKVAKALEANAAKLVSRFDKLVKRSNPGYFI